MIDFEDALAPSDIKEEVGEDGSESVEFISYNGAVSNVNFHKDTIVPGTIEISPLRSEEIETIFDFLYMKENSLKTC